jgi:hypothetical protein
MGQYTVSRERVLRKILAVDKELVKNVSRFKPVLWAWNW